MNIKLLACLFEISTVSASITWHIDDDFNEYKSTKFTSIQDGINASFDGDTIIIYPGIYFENLIINKQLTLRGVCTENEIPVVDAGGFGTVITLSADGIQIEGLIATNSGNLSSDTGIKIYSNNNNISDNIVYNNRLGFCFESSNNNSFIGNTARNNDIGIKLLFSSINDITDNSVTNNEKYGINFYKTNNNIIRKNNIKNNINGGVLLQYSSKNNIINNNVSNNNNGIWLISSNNNNIVWNNVNNNHYNAILLCEYSDNNNITNNNIKNNNYGIVSATQNKISLNNFFNNNHNLDYFFSSNIRNSTHQIEEVNKKDFLSEIYISINDYIILIAILLVGTILLIGTILLVGTIILLFYFLTSHKPNPRVIFSGTKTENTVIRPGPPIISPGTKTENIVIRPGPPIISPGTKTNKFNVIKPAELISTTIEIENMRWKRNGKNCFGFFSDEDYKYEGKIILNPKTNVCDPFIKNPPQSVFDGDHASCFHIDEEMGIGWYYVHLNHPNNDPVLTKRTIEYALKNPYPG